MTETKFTPAPWEVYYYENNNYQIYVDNSPHEDIIIAEISGKGVTQGSIRYNQNIANAALIASAPEMYMLLKQILDSHKTGGASGGGDVILSKMVEDAIEEELKKARGE